MKKVLMFIGSRANFGRLKMVIIELLTKGHKVDIVKGSYDIPLAYKHLVVLEVDNLMFNDTNSNMATSISIVSLAVTIFLAGKKNYYDVAIVHADRFENLGFAVAASYNKIPLLHTEGGETTGNIDNKIRYAITSLADIHCAASKKALENIRGHLKYFTGSPAIDFVASLGFLHKKPSRNYILVLFNPADGEDPNILKDAISELSVTENIIWVNPNVDPGAKQITKCFHNLSNIKFKKNLQPYAYYELLYNAKLLIGNTSSGIKEGAYLGIPYLLVGDRQRGREVGPNVIHVELKKNDILYAARKTLSYTPKPFKIGYFDLFGKGDASMKIVKIIEEVC